MKKLTAGIFTALLGLVTVNAANAAIPSTNYVEERIGEIRSGYEAADTNIRNNFIAADTALGTRIDGVETAYKAADTTTLNSAKDYTNQQVGTLTDLTTTAKGNTVVAINEVNEAIGTDTMGEIKTGENASVNPTTLTQAVNALNAKIDYKTSGIATDAALSDLTTQVNTNKTDISGLETRMDTAEGEIDDLQAKDTELSGLISTNAAAIETNKTAIAGKAAQSDVTALTTRVTTAEGAINTLASEKADETSVVERLAQKATVASVDAVADKADANEAAISTLGTSKLNVSEHEANHVVITDGSGNVTTSATITQEQVADLTDDLAAKMTDVTTVSEAGSEDGVYVLTAKIVGDETTYKWELIQRYDNTPK